MLQILNQRKTERKLKGTKPSDLVRVKSKSGKKADHNETVEAQI